MYTRWLAQATASMSSQCAAVSGTQRPAIPAATVSSHCQRLHMTRHLAKRVFADSALASGKTVRRDSCFALCTALLSADPRLESGTSNSHDQLASLFRIRVVCVRFPGPCRHRNRQILGCNVARRLKSGSDAISHQLVMPNNHQHMTLPSAVDRCVRVSAPILPSFRS